MKFIQFTLLNLLGAGLLACSSYYNTGVKTERYTMRGGNDAKIDSLIEPYRTSLHAEMSKVIGTTYTDLSVMRPNCSMGQWVTDAVWKFGIDSVIGTYDTISPVIGLFNTGGLRATIAAGDITVGDIYKVMPFDNMVTAVKLPMDSLPSVFAYIQRTGGEPVSNCSIDRDGIELYGQTAATGHFWVVTTDFLANGGDKMYFLLRPLSRIDSPKLVRDLLMEDVLRRKELFIRTEDRIRL